MKVFISHQRRDNEFVKKLVSLFRKYNIQYWVDMEQTYKKIIDIDKEINEGIKGSTHFLLIWSSNAEKSKYVKREVKQVFTKSSNIQPFSFRISNSEFKGDFYKFKRFPYETIRISQLEEKNSEFYF
jgi:hypothetical protein